MELFDTIYKEVSDFFSIHFGKFFEKKKKESPRPDFLNDLAADDDFGYVMKTAKLISNYDNDVLSRIGQCIDDTDSFVRQNSERYKQWAMDPDNTDRETLILTGFIDELTEAGYLFPTDISAEFDDFSLGITGLRTYKSMKIDLSGLEFDPDRSTLEWCRKINEQFRDIRQLCCIDIGGEDLNLVWLNNETIMEIAAVTENTEISIEAVGIKQY